MVVMVIYLLKTIYKEAHNQKNSLDWGFFIEQ